MGDACPPGGLRWSTQAPPGGHMDGGQTVPGSLGPASCAPAKAVRRWHWRPASGVTGETARGGQGRLSGAATMPAAAPRKITRRADGRMGPVTRRACTVPRLSGSSASTGQPGRNIRSPATHAPSAAGASLAEGPAGSGFWRTTCELRV